VIGGMNRMEVLISRLTVRHSRTVWCWTVLNRDLFRSPLHFDFVEKKGAAAFDVSF
jgi:hypothetical protein